MVTLGNQHRGSLDGRQGQVAISGATLGTNTGLGWVMAITTVFVHLNDKRRASALAAAAVAMARPSGAHVVGLHVMASLPAVTTTLSIPYGEDVADAIRRAEARDSDAIAGIFRDATAPAPERATWIAAVSPGADIAAFVMKHGRSSDLIVASEADPTWDLAPVLDFPERLVMESGRPVLLVPNAGRFDQPPRHAVLAWNGRREASRAAFDALAAIDRGCQVSLLVIEEDGAGGHARESAEAMAVTARRHGFAAQVVRTGLGGRSIGAALVAETANLGGDLLVMGAYGHSRLREFVFGGATRYVTHHMPCRILVSH